MVSSFRFPKKGELDGVCIALDFKGSRMREKMRKEEREKRNEKKMREEKKEMRENKFVIQT